MVGNFNSKDPVTRALGIFEALRIDMKRTDHVAHYPETSGLGKINWIVTHLGQ